MKALIIGFLLALSVSSQAATNCTITLTDSDTNKVLNQRIHFEFSHGLSGRGGQHLYTYQEDNSESVRLVYGLALGDHLARFFLRKAHTVTGTGTIEEIDICDVDLVGGVGKEDCYDENLAVALACEQLDEGESVESYQAVARRLNMAKTENDRLLKCAVNLEMKFDGLSENRQEKMSGKLFKEFRTKKAILVNAQSARALDMNINVEKKLFGCEITVDTMNPANASSGRHEKVRAISCMKALNKILKHVPSCED